MFSVKCIESGIIFEKCTIQEISDVERKLRQEIEKKKEDLRQMVGERYRELIEAADTITEMKNGTEKVASSIITLQELCQNLKQSSVTFHKLLQNKHPTKVQTPLASRIQLNKFNQSICLKLLMDIPNKIWSYLDGEEYLNATRTYLLAEHLHTCTRSGEHSSKLINILARQWTTVSHLRTTIVKGVEAKLMDSKLSEKATAECMCSIVLLREISVQDVFVEFLKSREELIKQLFNSCGVDSTVKPLICDVITIIITTLRQVDAVFIEKNDSEGMLITMLQEALTCNNSDFFGANGFGLSDASMKYLPSQILNFKPSLKIPLKAVDKSFTIKHCSEFVDRASDHTHSGVHSLLSFVATIKALSDIRDAVYLLIKQNVESCNWQYLCSEVVGRELNIWVQLLREHFLHRMRLLLQHQMDSLLSATELQVTRMLEDFGDLNMKSLASERNLSSYVWSESPGDVPQNAVWTPISQRITSASREGGLYMKAKGHTPGVQSLCLSINNKVKILLDDVTSYINPSVFQTSEASTRLSTVSTSSTSNSIVGFLPSVFASWRSDPTSQTKSTLEDSFADRFEVQDLLRTTCTSFLIKLIEFLKSQLQTYREEIANNNNNDNNIAITLQRALFLGRVSSGLGDLSPSLEKCVMHGEQSAVVNNETTIKKLPKPSLQLTNKNWSEVVEKLDELCCDVYGIWSDYVVESLSNDFKRALLYRGDNTYSAFMSSCTQWESTIIEEENEEGNVVKSTIKVPMQTSWFVQDILYKLCTHLNVIGGHVVSGSTISTLVRKLLNNILLIYHDLLSSPPPSSSPSFHQSRALQMWFDIKYLIGVLSSAKDEQTPGVDSTTTCTRVLEILEGHVDPFDLDVFRPHLKKQLTRLLQRSNILFGLILSPERSTFASFQSSASGQEQHHIVPLATGINRFHLLPLSHQNNKMAADNAPPKLPQKTLDAISSGHQINKTFNTASSTLPPPPPPVPQKDQNLPPRASSSSFLEQMSTLFGGSSATNLYIK